MRAIKLILLTTFFLLFCPLLLLAQNEIPQAGVQAEEAENWVEAVRIYKTILELEPTNPTIWTRLANVEGRRGNHIAAAEAFQKTADLLPNNADAHYQLSRAYALIEQPDKALPAIKRALELEPNNLEYLRASTQYANWQGDYHYAKRGYKRILEQQPGDAVSLLGLARVKAWSGDVDEATGSYKSYIKLFPQDATAYIEYARVESWRGNYAKALLILEDYKHLFGETKQYYELKARLLAWVLPNETLDIVNARLESEPDNFELNLANSIGLANARHPREAMRSLSVLKRIAPEDPEARSVRDYVRTPWRPFIAPSISFYQDSDGLRIYHFNLEGSYTLRPGAILRGGISGDRLQARVDSGLEQLDGDTQAKHLNTWVGVDYRFSPELAVIGLVGEAVVESKDHIATYLLAAEINPHDRLGFNLEHEHGFFIVSPRTVGMGIEQSANRFQINWRPATRYYLDTSFAYNRLSDGNSSWETGLAPRREVLRTEHFNLDLGLRARWLSYSKDLNNGYYDPSLYQYYSVSSIFYWKISENNGISLIADAGAQKDNLMRDFRFGSNLSAECTIGIYRDLMLKLRSTLTYNGRLQSGAFRGHTMDFVLTWRF